MFAKGSGDLIYAYKVFEKMFEKNGVTWTLIFAYKPLIYFLRWF